MDPETFTTRKNFLEEFFKKRVKLTNTKITISQDGFIDFDYMDYTDLLFFKTCAELYNIDDLNIDIKEVYKLIKPFIYYLFSVTSKKKFLQRKPLLIDNIIIEYRFYVGDVTTKINMDIDTGTGDYHYDSQLRFSFLEHYNEKELSDSHVVNSVNNVNLSYFGIDLRTFYAFNNYDDYVSSIGELEENGEIVVNSQPRYSEEIREIVANLRLRDNDDEEEKIINSSQTFKSNECVICLTNSPNILYCNCGHIPICKECDKIKTLSSCPVCKTENTILRLIE